INRMLGREGAALQDFDESTALLRTLTTAQPGVAEFRAALAYNEDQRGMLFWESGDDQASRAKVQAILERTIPLWEQVIQAKPGQLDYESQLAMDYYRLAMMLSVG